MRKFSAFGAVILKKWIITFLKQDTLTILLDHLTKTIFLVSKVRHALCEISAMD